MNYKSFQRLTHALPLTLTLLLALLWSVPARAGYLHANGVSLVDGTGATIIPVGPNTGAWLLSDPFWFDGVNLGGSWNQPPTDGDTSHTLLPQIQEVTGEWVKVDDNDASVSYSSGWNFLSGYNPGYNKTEHWTTTVGNTATYTFAGTQARFYGYKRYDLGYANLYVDGVFKTSVDCYAPSAATQYDALLYEVTGLTASTHNLTVIVSGSKNAASGGIQIICDGFAAGSPAAHGFSSIRQAWYDNLIAEADIAKMASLGFNSVRVPFDARLFGTITWNANGRQIITTDTNSIGFQYLDKVVQWCETYHIYAILDMHIVPFGITDDQASLDSTASLWQTIAARYRTSAFVGGYDLWNEPNWPDGNFTLNTAIANPNINSTIVYINQQLLNAIRQVDTNHLVIAEGYIWDDRIDTFFYSPATGLVTDTLQLSDPAANLALSFHRYGGTLPDVYDPASDSGPDGSDYSGTSPDYLWTIPHQKKLAAMANVPLWCGEAGYNVNDFIHTQFGILRSGTGSADFGIAGGGAFWSYKRNSSWGVVQCPSPQGDPGFNFVNQYWSQLNTWWSNGRVGAKPTPGFTPAQADAWLYAYAQSLNAANCTANLDVVDALTRFDGTSKAFVADVAIPGTIFAVNYDLGFEGVAYHETSTGANGGMRNNTVNTQTCTDPGVGYNITSFQAGEWLRYTVTCAAGSYPLKIRYNGSGASVHVLVDGVNVSGTVALPSNGNWTTYTVASVPVAASGTVKLDIVCDSGPFSLNWIQFDNGIVSVPSIPSAPVATARNAGAALSWNASLFATSYYVKRSTVSGGPYTITGTTTQTSYVDGSLANGTTYYYVISAVDSSGQSPNSAEVSVTPASPSLPVGWAGQDIGTVGFPNYANYAGGVYTVQAAGTSVWSTSDSFGYCYEPVSGDGMMTVRVASIQNTYYTAKAGIMFRDSTATNAAYAFLAVTPGGGIRYEYRSANGASAASAGNPSGTAPVWLRLVRLGSSFSGFYSADGTNWTQIGSGVAITMSTTMLAGLAVCANTNSTINVSTFDNLTTAGFGSPVTPTGLTAISGSSGITLAWAASASATSYNVKRGTVSGGPYTTIASPDSAGWVDATASNHSTYYYVVTAVNAVGESINSSEAMATLNLITLPSGWIDQDIQVQTYLGSADFSNTAVFTVRGSGTNIWSSADSFNYCYKSVSGTGTITARVTSLQNTNSGAKAGVMWRESTGANARFAMVSVTPGGSIRFDRRSSTGGSVSATTVTGAAPVWVRITRGNSNKFYAYYSADGVTWTQIGSSSTISMATSALVGMAVTAVNQNALNTATFDRVSAPGFVPPSAPTGLTSTSLSTAVNLSWNAAVSATSYSVKRAIASGGPYSVIASTTGVTWSDATASNHTSYYYIVTAVGIPGESANSSEVIGMPNLVTIPTTWSDQDVGSNGTLGSADYSSGVFTLRGSGTWIWSTADSFHFCYQPFTGDGTISARVLTIQNTDTYAQAGVMFRESLAANSRYVYMGVTYGGGIRLEYRATTGGAAASIAVTSGSAPAWVKLVRTGSNFSGFSSVDGSTWSSVGTAVVSMATAAYEGLAVSAHNNTALNTATFDNVITPVPYAPPSAVTDLTITTMSAGAALKWSPVAGAAGYTIKRAAGLSGSYVTVATGVTGSGFTDTSGSLVRGMLYYYTISGTNSIGEGSNATRVAAMPLLPFPKLQCIAGSAVVSLVSSAGVTYQLQTGDVLGSGTWSNVGAPVAGNDGTIQTTDTNATQGSRRFYQVQLLLPP